MTIILIYPPQIESRYMIPFFPESSLPPLGLASLAAFLEKHDFQVKIIDASLMKLSLNKLVKLVKRLKPSFIGLTMT
ncbi:MAG: hypothetical protein ACTSRS_20300 [Candidatus Helarchaeota archaeon]